MNTLAKILTISAMAGAATLCGCEKKQPAKPGSSGYTAPTDGATDDHDGDDHDHDHSDADDDHDDHDHGDEVSLGTTMVGEHEVECAQGHGTVEPGKEGHLVVKLPFNDEGQTIVRAWIGTDDRLASIVGLGEYAPSHDDYDIHAEAPAPLPEGATWWIEIEEPDGTKSLGSIDFH